MFEHFDPYKHGLSHGVEKQSDEDEVIRIGYRTTEEQVNEFMAAGVSLAKARGEVYMYANEDSVDEDDLPLSRYAEDPVESFDLLQYQKELKAKKEEKAKARAEARAAKAAAAAEGSDAKQSDKGGEGGDSGAEREARAPAT